ncbi:MAG: polymer-forming cytoskeletal protein [Candidatus Komeilibacteria bacterium]|nr:polymer-forming cytoskeletal protein [Candidatus Komeilibacteria bacterium]
MFNKEARRNGGAGKINEGENETIIGQTVKVDGDFISDGNVLVQGMVNGSLKTRGDLRVEKGAKIKADVEAANALVAGQIKGNVCIQNSLELYASAVVEGDISAKILSIEPGAILNGHCLVAIPDKVATEAEPAPVQKPQAQREKS